MSNQYIDAEVDKIFQDQSLEFPKNMALATAWMLAHFKGFNLKIIDVSSTSSFTDYFIIGSANNITQSNSMMDEILQQFKKRDYRPLSVEGTGDSQWILVDYGDVVIHIFQDLSRDIYDLDSLWSENPQIPIPNEYYFGPGNNAETGTADDSKDRYF